MHTLLVPNLRFITLQRSVSRSIEKHRIRCILVDPTYGLSNSCAYFQRDFLDLVFDTAGSSSSFVLDGSPHLDLFHPRLIVEEDCALFVAVTAAALPTH